MSIEEYLPTAQLRPYIKAYRIIESPDGIVNRVVPDTSFAMAFRFRGQISYLNDSDKIILPAATFSGLRKSVRLINYAPQSSALIVLLRETGATGFFRQPLHELFEKSVPLDGFFSRSEISIMEERLGETNSNRKRIAMMERFLCSKLFCNKPDKLVSEAIARIYENNGLTRIRELSDSLFISQDAFEKRFRKVTGTTPKQFSSIVRLKTIVRKKPPLSSLLDVALTNGYYDQSHFNKDFKRFTGQTPADFFQSGSHW
jgi:AraC-like DNA-binding protein